MRYCVRSGSFLRFISSPSRLFASIDQAPPAGHPSTDRRPRPTADIAVCLSPRAAALDQAPVSPRPPSSTKRRCRRRRRRPRPSAGVAAAAVLDQVPVSSLPTKANRCHSRLPFTKRCRWHPPRIMQSSHASSPNIHLRSCLHQFSQATLSQDPPYDAA
ncbi:uncharacterized protein LOC119321252 [Triticum dicoccoides]|uniref:uncharacterized protein LOC119321252 n=1 Tax=Triticum dicoccoides TaxID=85692 RepID=UPI0018918121|nr:uncharacterized protein LOC119321252 [Triticum dicoccoides]